MPQHDLSQLRLQLVTLGYRILPNRAKVPVINGWNTPEYVQRELTDGPRGSVAEMLARWPLRWPQSETISIRLDDTVVIDIDVDDPLVETVMEAIHDIAPEVYRFAPMRYGAGPYKRALFCRLADGEEAFRRLASHKYTDSGHCVEVFGGGRLKGDKCSRQFGVYGVHSYKDDGTIAAEYRWDEEGSGLHEVAHANLPRITKAQCAAICDAFDAIATGSGWPRVVSFEPDNGDQKKRIYDIDDDTRFELQGEEIVGYDELEVGMRCSSSFHDGISHNTRDKCHVGYSPLHDCVVVYDYETDATHYPKHYAPVDPSEMAGKLKAVLPAPAEPPEPEPGADLHTKASWLIDARAYFEAEDAVVQLYSTSLDCRTTPTAFGRRFKHWHQSTGKTRGGIDVLSYATVLWELSPSRRNIAGVRMRPDRPFPLFEEAGKVFKNTYRRPVHAAGGEVEPFAAFITRFIPDPLERTWLLDWMAHKQARPDIPGTSIFLVADTDEDVREGKFGTGRGLFFTILHRLYGEDYTKAEDFNIIDGSSGQSVYTDWMHGSILVTVDEAKTSSTAHRRGERNAAYEVLKNIVDPAPKRRSFKGKNRQAFDGMSYCSFVVATNHANAAAIPESDRRFTVLRNGDVMKPAEAIETVAWMAEPANIGALSRALAARDLSTFDMMAPLVTAGKAEMAELARSDVEEVLRDIMEDETRGKVFAKPHIEAVLKHNFSESGSYWQGELKGAWHAYCVGVKTEKGGYRQVRMLGTQKKLFCFRVNKRKVDRMREVEIKREVEKWGDATYVPGDMHVVGGTDKDQGEQQLNERLTPDTHI